MKELIVLLTKNVDNEVSQLKRKREVAIFMTDEKRERKKVKKGKQKGNREAFISSRRLRWLCMQAF